MNPYDPLETELRALAPREVSPDLKPRIANQLRVGALMPSPPLASPPPSSSPQWGIALAGGLAAACLAAIALWWTSGTPVGLQPIVNVTPPAPPTAVDDLRPTILAYRHVLVRSPEDLNALLDQHAFATLPPDSQTNPIRAFTRPDADFFNRIGEL